MECLYQVREKNTFEEVKKFNWAFVKRKPGFWIVRILSGLCFLVFAGFFLYLGYFYYRGLLALGLIYLAAAICEPFIAVWQGNRRIRKEFESNAIHYNTDSCYEFYDTYFLDIDTHGMTRIEYRELFGILETKTNFYLMQGKSMGCLLCKANFPEGLAEFLRRLNVKKL